MATKSKPDREPEPLRIDRNNWYFEHPKYNEIVSYGFQDKVQQRIAMLTYLDLCEVKNWFSVDVHACSELQMVYLAGVANKKDEVQHILPISSDMPLSNQRLQQFIKLLKPHKCKEDLSPSGSSDVITSSKHSFVQLAVNDSDSTIVYYKISDELIPPDPPKQTLLKEVGKGKRRKRKAILLPQQPDEPVTDDENWGDEL